MPRSLPPLQPVPIRTGARSPMDAVSPLGHRWGVGAKSALDYLRHDREKIDPEGSQAHPVASDRSHRPR